MSTRSARHPFIRTLPGTPGAAIRRCRPMIIQSRVRYPSRPIPLLPVGIARPFGRWTIALVLGGALGAGLGACVSVPPSDVVEVPGPLPAPVGREPLPDTIGPVYPYPGYGTVSPVYPPPVYRPPAYDAPRHRYPPAYTNPPVYANPPGAHRPPAPITPPAVRMPPPPPPAAMRPVNPRPGYIQRGDEPAWTPPPPARAQPRRPSLPQRGDEPAQ